MFAFTSLAFPFLVQFAELNFIDFPVRFSQNEKFLLETPCDDISRFKTLRSASVKHFLFFLVRNEKFETFTVDKTPPTRAHDNVRRAKRDETKCWDLGFTLGG